MGRMVACHESIFLFMHEDPQIVVQAIDASSGTGDRTIRARVFDCVEQLRSRHCGQLTGGYHTVPG